MTATVNRKVPIQLEIAKWNLDRNSLQFNPVLEVSMLSEEVHEFFTADSLVNRLDAYCDFLFVWEGTQAKLNSQSITTVDQLLALNKAWDDLEAYAHRVMAYMFTNLTRELTLLLPTLVSAETIIMEVLNLIMEANQKKGVAKGPDGKIIKGPDYVPPEETIKEYLRGLGVRGV